MKEILEKIKEDIKRFFKNLGAASKEFIKAFLEPVAESQDLSELAYEAGLGQDEIKALKKGGISWKSFSREDDKDVKGFAKGDVITQENQIQSEQINIPRARNIGSERE